jgi:[acyl-carrier-protein] S-malonyltransferase
MGKVAFLFPGQGAQSVGMGRAFHDADPELRALFEEANQTLGEPFSQWMLEGPEARLNLTENTQPALVITAMAAYRLVIRETTLRPDFVAGHSLGEYAALCAAGGLSFADTIRLVRIRGQAMQAAVPPGVGSMAAMLNMASDQVESVCRDAAQQTGATCVPANYNNAAQIVISGHAAAVDKAVELAKALGAKRCVILKVSAPFHSPLMAPAAAIMAQALADTPLHDLTVPLVANVTATPVIRADAWRPLLVEQVTGAVRWEASMRYLLDQGVDHFVELGTGKVLSGLMRRIDRKARVTTINTPGDLATLSHP